MLPAELRRGAAPLPHTQAVLCSVDRKSFDSWTPGCFLKGHHQGIAKLPQFGSLMVLRANQDLSPLR